MDASYERCHCDGQLSWSLSTSKRTLGWRIEPVSGCPISPKQICQHAGRCDHHFPNPRGNRERCSCPTGVYEERGNGCLEKHHKRLVRISNRKKYLLKQQSLAPTETSTMFGRISTPFRRHRDSNRAKEAAGPQSIQNLFERESEDEEINLSEDEAMPAIDLWTGCVSTKFLAAFFAVHVAHAAHAAHHTHHRVVPTVLFL